MIKMKDSGIAWIGDIPSDWNVAPNKRVMQKSKIICDKYNNENVLSLTMNGVIVRDLENPTGKMPLTFDGYQYVQAGNLLMCLFDIDVTPRCVGVINNDGVTSPAYSQFKLLNDNYVRYYYYYYLYLDFTKELLHLAKNLRHSLTESQLGEIYVPVPPLETQHRIADYLDKKCAKIDAIIEKQQAVIEKLKEYKLSVITEAVTKGLTPNVEMKDSGVDWIGKTPKNWSVIKFGKIATVNSQLVSPDDYQDSYQISPEHIEKNSGKLLGYSTVKEMGVISNNNLFHKGDILYTKIRPNLNKVVIAPFDGLCSAEIYPLQTTEKTAFILFMLLSDYFVSQVSIVIQDRVKMPKINRNELANIWCCLPPLEEQETIAEALKNKLMKINLLLDKKQNLINKLTAYKKSLIYEVVTGKKEV